MISSYLLRRSVIPLLSVLIAWEWLSPRAVPTSVHAPSTAPQQIRPAKVVDHRLSYIETILARPLFSTNRQPSSDDTRQTEGLPRLSGVLIAGANRRAIFESGRKPLVASVGDEIAAYKIIAITPQYVTMSGSGGLQIVKLTFNGDRPVPPARSAAARVPNALEQLEQQTPQQVPLPQPPSVRQLLTRLQRAQG